MKNFLLPIVCASMLLLSACGKTTTSESQPVVTPTVTETPATSGSGVVPNTASGTQSATLLSKDTQAIINIQLKAPDDILKLDCNTYDAEGKAYCEAEKTKMQTLLNEVTWQKVLVKGDEYIKTFDCSTIVSTYGQKYCTDHKAKLTK